MRFWTPANLVAVLAVGSLAACSSDARPQAAAAAPAVVRSHAAESVTQLLPTGLVLTSGAMAGRVLAGDHVTFLSADGELLTLDTVRRIVRRRQVPEGRDTSMWGLGRLADGTLWTLQDRLFAVRLSDEGVIRERVPLPEPHLGLHGWRDTLIYQKVDWHPPSLALSFARPRAAERQPFGSIRTRALPVPRAYQLALNTVTCGVGLGSVLPCWFAADGTTIDLVTAAGSGSSFTIPDIAPVRPETIAVEAAPRPVRDVVAAADGVISALLSPVDASAKQTPPGGTILARYSPTGHLLSRVQLDQPARFILRLDGHACLFLGSAGKVLEGRCR